MEKRKNLLELALPGVLTSLATAAVLAVAGVVVRAPSIEEELKYLRQDVARLDARCDTIEQKLDTLIIQQRK